MIDMSHLFQDYINAGGKIRQPEFFEEVVQGILKAGYKITGKNTLASCNKCGSDELDIVSKGPHQSLVCTKCSAFQKHLSKSDADTFRKLREE